MRLREYTVPLQAFAALFICSGLAWMIFVTAGFDPNPPTSTDIQLRSTQDLSFAQMNSTAAALALHMISEYMPTPIVLPATGAPYTPTATITATFSPFFTPLPRQTSASIFSLLFPPTKTRVHEPDPPPRTPTPVWTLTLQPTSTKTRTPIPTRPLPTASATLIPTTAVPPTVTPEPTDVPTEQPTAEPTATSGPTEVPTEQPTQQQTEEPTATESATANRTPDSVQETSTPE